MTTHAYNPRHRDCPSCAEYCKAREADVIHRRLLGQPYQEIADAYGLTREMIRLILKDSGLPVVVPVRWFRQLGEVGRRFGLAMTWQAYRAVCPFGPHGQRGSYDQGCRCSLCRNATVTYARRFTGATPRVRKP